jgi:hypothetical protein
MRQLEGAIEIRFAGSVRPHDDGQWGQIKAYTLERSVTDDFEPRDRHDQETTSMFPFVPGLRRSVPLRSPAAGAYEAELVFLPTGTRHPGAELRSEPPTEPRP